MTRNVPFQPAESVGEAVRLSITERMAKSQKELVQTMMAPENVLRYAHGSRWAHPALSNSSDGKMQTHTAEFTLPFRRILDGDLSIVRESIEHVSLHMKRQFLQSMYGLVTETCEQTGNTVSAGAAGGLAEAIEQMLQKVEFGVDSNGNVSLPQIHVADDGPLRAALESQPNEFHQRIDAIIKVKTDAALAQEAMRKAKFLEQP